MVNNIRAYTLFLFFLCALPIATGLSCSEQHAHDALQQSINEKLLRQPRPQLLNGAYDIIDYPLAPGMDILLENCQQAGTFVSLHDQFAGELVVFYEINPIHQCWDDSHAHKVPAGPQRLKAIVDRYQQKGVQFIGIFNIGGFGYQAPKKSYAERMDMAKSYVEAHNIPGLVLVNGDPDRKKYGSRFSPFKVYLGPQMVGNSKGGLAVFIRGKDGRFVYRGWEQVGFGYHATRLILERMTNSDFDKAVRSEFYPNKIRTLPIREKRADGLAYRDDFESYPDNHSFKLEPRWGFSYEGQSRIDLNAELVEHAGHNKSTGVCVAHKPLGYVNVDALIHTLPAPLTDGTLCFSVRRRPVTLEQSRAFQVREEQARRLQRDYLPYRSIEVRFGKPNSYDSTGVLFATGSWLQEHFCLNHRRDNPPTTVLSEQDWHQVTVTCTPGQKAQVHVDGVAIGQLRGESIGDLSFRVAEKGKAYYIDNVEVFYRGQAEHILAAHETARPIHTQAVEAFSAREQQALETFFPHVNCGTVQAPLGPNAIPRADIIHNKGTFTFDHPLTIDSLVMMDARNQGATVDVLKKYRGKIICIMIAAGVNESGIRKRSTSSHSHTSFNRNYRLWSEYKNSDIVFIGRKGDVGHRTTANTVSDLSRTALDLMRASADFADERNLARDQIMTGSFNEMFDEVLVEHRPNWLPAMLKWGGQAGITQGTGNSSFLRSMHSSGVFAILNPEGHIVFRGGAMDGNTYWQLRATLDRLLDTTFDAAIRQEFRNPTLKHYRSPLLPIIKEQENGLTYRDDFESYDDSYDFFLQPRWGFHYFRWLDPTISTQNAPTPFVGEGRNNSTAILLHKQYNADAWCGNKTEGLNAEHRFPALLKDGHFSLYVRRGPHVAALGEPALFRLGLTCLDENGQQLDTLTTFGPWKKEHFGMMPSKQFLKWNIYTVRNKKMKMIPDHIDTGIAMAENDWQQITIRCTPKQNARIFIDQQQVAELPTETLSGIQLVSETWSSFYIDDAELFYAGNAATLTANHAQILTDSLAEQHIRWQEEADAWNNKINTNK